MRILARAMDDEGNVSDLLTVKLMNKAKEYKITVKKDDLYVREAFFKYPESLEDLITVIKSLIASARMDKLLTKSQVEF